MIRQFRAGDETGCYALVSACIESDHSIKPELRTALLRAESPGAMQNRASLYYLAVDAREEEIRALGGIELNEIRLLLVAPRHRGQGIASALLEHLESLAPAMLFRDVFVYSTPSAESFYRARGYVSGGKHEFALAGMTIPTVFMSKRLLWRNEP